MTNEEYDAFVKSIKEKIKKCEDEIKSLNNEIEEYSADFAILSEQEVSSVVPLLAIIEDFDTLIDCLKTSINNYTNHLEYLKGVGKIIDGKILNVSSLLDENANFSNLRSKVDEKHDMIKNIAVTIDILKEEIATNIAKLKGQIDEKEIEISHLKRQINC